MECAQSKKLYIDSLITECFGIIADIQRDIQLENQPTQIVQEMVVDEPAPLEDQTEAIENKKAGFVYAMWSPMAEDKVKIGFTSLNVEERLDSMNNTSIPIDQRYQLVCSLASKDARESERQIHTMLKEYRDHAKREFFRISKEYVQDIFKSLASTEAVIPETVKHIISENQRKVISELTLEDFESPPKKKRKRQGAICEHEKVRSKCAACGGGSICSHFKFRSCCKICCPNHFCKHGKIRESCTLCTVGSDTGTICIHQKIRAACRTCAPHLWCVHNFKRYDCRTCSPHMYCEHKLRRSKCKQCSSHLVCKHGLIRNRCTKCKKAAVTEPSEKVETTETIETTEKTSKTKEKETTEKTSKTSRTSKSVKA